MKVSSSANSLADRRDLVVAAPDAPGGRVEAQVADLEHGRALDGARGARGPAAARAAPRRRTAWSGSRRRRVSSPATRSSTASRAVSISTGAQTPSARSRRQASKPSMPGSITSRTIASYSVAPAIQSASSPLTATSAAMPSSRRPRRIRLAIFTSSSTIRTRMPPPSVPASGAVGSLSHIRAAALAVAGVCRFPRAPQRWPPRSPPRPTLPRARVICPAEPLESAAQKLGSNPAPRSRTCTSTPRGRIADLESSESSGAITQSALSTMLPIA